VKRLFPEFGGPEEHQHTLPETPRPYAELLDRLQKWQKLDASGENGRHFAYIYDPDETQFKEFVKNAYMIFWHENALNPTAFPALRKLEMDVIQMTARMLNAPSTAVGTLTSGGTESILCAIKAYRERARAIWPHITEPEIVAPITAHVAFPKGGHLFDVKFVFVPIDEKTCTPRIEDYAKAITSNTILLVGSAPAYPHGVIDPIEQIAQLARGVGPVQRADASRVLPLHVDACLGGFILPFVERLNYPVKKWDFRVPGVTSISADCHKFGYAPKGASTLIFCSNEYRKYQFWSFTKWPGGLFMSPSLLGTRAGGPIAGAWAAMVGLGVSGFVKITQKVMRARDAFIAGIKAIPHLKILGEPEGPIIAFTTQSAPHPDSRDGKLAKPNVLVVADIMQDKYKWGMERQQNPNCIHLTVMPRHLAIVNDFLRDLADAVQTAIREPERENEGSAAMYGMTARIPSAELIESYLIELESQIFDVPRDG